MAQSRLAFFSQLGFDHRPRRLQNLWAHKPSLPLCTAGFTRRRLLSHAAKSCSCLGLYVFFWCLMLTWFFSRSFIWRRQSRQENWRINTSRTFLPFKRYFSNVTVLQNMWKESNSELQALSIYRTVYEGDKDPLSGLGADERCFWWNTVWRMAVEYVSPQLQLIIQILQKGIPLHLWDMDISSDQDEDFFVFLLKLWTTHF